MNTHGMLQDYIDINHPGYDLIRFEQKSNSVDCMTKNKGDWYNLNIPLLDLLTFVYNENK